tara:strand:+ start:61 stop:909 length:849 start_codon:yes stop_codon:yes gene_type:complete
MATRNFVPRSGSEGQLGTITKPWDKVIAITSSFTVHSGSITGDHLTLVSGSSTSTGSFGHLIIAGNITASGTVRADAFESVTGGTAISFNDSLNVSGNVTASGDLKIDDLTASGRVSAVSFGGIFEGALSQSAQIASNISGSFVAPSSSFSTRITTEEANVDALQADSGSFSTRLTAITSSISALKTNSGSFSTRVTNLKTDSGSFSTRVTNLKTDSGSFSDRVTLSEASSSAILEGNFVFTNITASGNISASGDILANGRIFEKGTSVIDHATAMSIVFGG